MERPTLSQLHEEARVAREAVLRSTAAAFDETDLAAVAARVAEAVARAEAPDARARWVERFADWMCSGRFLPSIPILSNAGRLGQLAACFVLEAEDSLDSIYDTLRRAARIQQGSGGVGIDFSRLRPRGAPLERSGGVSSGPTAFVELCAHSARINSMAGRRPGAHLAVLRDDHPDVLEFVDAARSRSAALAGAGLAVGLRDALLEAAERGAPHALRDPRAGEVRRVPARELLEAIARSILETGQPTLLFLDAIEAANPAPHLGPIRATNPCGEQPLLPGESCVLGALHLPAFADAAGRVDAAALEEAARDAIRFLDDVVEVNAFPDEATAEASRRTRKVGLGVMGFADLLLLRGQIYGSDASQQTVAEVMAPIASAARRSSVELARGRGPYPAWRGEGPPRRNASLLAVAPTGTLRLLVGSSGGLEPFLDPVLRVEARGARHRWIDRWLLDWLGANVREPARLLAALEAGAVANALPDLDPARQALLRRAYEVPPEEQIAIQARFQSFVDGAVSKTVHLPPDTAEGRVLELVRLARAMRCKGVAFYRPASLATAAAITCAT